MNKFIENQNWRYATKKFDNSKKVSNEDLNTLKEAIRLSASSYGLQPYTVYIIENSEIKEKLKPFAYGQNQITDASHVIVFANKLNVGDTEIEAYVKNIGETRGIPSENLNGFANYMKGNITNLSEETRNIWTSKQTYLALGNLLNAAAEMKIDTTPMEGFDPKGFNEILGLNEKGLNAAVVATVGYRHKEDETQNYKKVRKSNEDLFITL
jgi:nitroreductase